MPRSLTDRPARKRPAPASRGWLVETWASSVCPERNPRASFCRLERICPALGTVASPTGVPGGRERRLARLQHSHEQPVPIVLVLIAALCFVLDRQFSGWQKSQTHRVAKIGL